MLSLDLLIPQDTLRYLGGLRRAAALQGFLPQTQRDSDSDNMDLAGEVL